MKNEIVSRNTLITAGAVIVIALLLIFIYWNNQSADTDQSAQQVDTESEFEVTADEEDDGGSNEQEAEDGVMSTSTSESIPSKLTEAQPLNMSDFNEKGDSDFQPAQSQTVSQDDLTNLITEAQEVTQAIEFDPERVAALLEAIREVVPILERERDNASDPDSEAALILVIDVLVRLEGLLLDMAG